MIDENILGKVLNTITEIIDTEKYDDIKRAL